MRHSRETEIAEIIVRSIVGQLSDSESDRLNRWLEEAPENVALYEKIASGESFREYLATGRRLDRAAVGRQIAARVSTNAVRRRVIKQVSIAVGFVGAAAVAALVLLFSPEVHDGPPTVAKQEWTVEQSRQAVLSYGDARVTLGDGEQESGWEKYVAAAEEQQQQAVQNVRVEIPLGGMYMLRLEDGTAVWLNSGSALEYPRTFADGGRAVTLRGEGYFEVAADSERPFEIAMNDGLAVRVLGTRFNVSAYDNLDYTTVTLVNGAVELLSLGEVTALAPDQQAVFDRTTGAIHRREVADAMAHAAWIHGVFDFKAEPLGDIMDALAQWYGMSVVYDGQIDVDAMGHFTMKVGRSEDLHSILSMLGKVTGLRYRVDGTQVHVSR
jgi:ferric-dicitrate binding protein FerR (iron transport regulator)